MFMGDMKFTTAGDFLASQESQLHYADDNIAETSGQETFNADGEYTPLIEGIRSIIPEFQRIFNTEKLESASNWYDNPIKDELDAMPMSQRAAEISKLFSTPINNLFGRLLKNTGIDLKVDLSDGYDWVYTNTRRTEIEDKNCMSQAFDTFNMWTGNANAGEKVSMHLLKRFQLNDKYQLVGAHVSLVNLDDTTQYWKKPKSGKGARSSLSFTTKDSRGIIPIMGYFHVPERGFKLFPRCEKI